MTTIGRPIRLKLYDLNENKSNDAANQVILENFKPNRYIFETIAYLILGEIGSDRSVK